MSWPAPTGDPIRPQGDGAQPTPGQAPGDQPSGTTPPPPTWAQVQPGAGYPPPTVPLPTQPLPTQPLPTTLMPAPLTPPAEQPTGAVASAAGPGHIDMLSAPAVTPPGLAKLSEKTGQPVRPWTIWASAVLMFGGAITVTVGLLLAMWVMASPWVEVADGWTKDDKFNEATWLTAQFPSEPASGWRVFFAIVCCVIAVAVAGTAAVIGYYAFAGYGWTRIGGLVALGVSLLSLLLTPIAAVTIGFVALGAAALWLPATRPFFARWQAVRHPQTAYSQPIQNVFYGPLPRYR